MPKYRLTYTPDDSKDGLGDPKTLKFSARDDEEALKTCAEKEREMIRGGGFITEKVLHRGYHVTVKIKRFRPTREVPFHVIYI